LPNYSRKTHYFAKFWKVIFAEHNSVKNYQNWQNILRKTFCDMWLLNCLPNLRKICKKFAQFNVERNDLNLPLWPPLFSHAEKHSFKFKLPFPYSLNKINIFSHGQTKSVGFFLHLHMSPKKNFAPGKIQDFELSKNLVNPI